MNKKHSSIQSILTILPFAASLLAPPARAEFSAPGQGLAQVLSGSMANGALYWQTTTNWINGAAPAKPFALTNEFVIPACEAIPAARLVLTVWGGTTNYTSHMTVAVNGTNLPAANPLIFGSGADANRVFSADSANAYGAGSGLWLVTLPVPGEMLYTNGSANAITVNQNTPDNFDGRIHHVTLVAVYQSSALANIFDYALAEGSGDIYRAPAAAQAGAREFTLVVSDSNVAAATLTVLYTYGDAGQNDRLYFNGVQLGGDDVAAWDKVGTGLDYGPSVASFDVKPDLQPSNSVKITAAASDGVPDTRESSLRPQLAVLTSTRLAAAQPPMLAIDKGGRLAWPSDAAGWILESTGELASGVWAATTNSPAIEGGNCSVVLDLAGGQRFYRLKKAN